MKAKSIKEYQKKCQPDGWSLCMESVLEIGALSSGPCSFHLEWHVGLKFVLVFFYRCSFNLLPKTSRATTYFWLQQSYTYIYCHTRCFGCSFILIFCSYGLFVSVKWTKQTKFKCLIYWVVLCSRRTKIVHGQSAKV